MLILLGRTSTRLHNIYKTIDLRVDVKELNDCLGVLAQLQRENQALRNVIFVQQAGLETQSLLLKTITVMLGIGPTC